MTDAVVGTFLDAFRVAWRRGLTVAPGVMGVAWDRVKGEWIPVDQRVDLVGALVLGLPVGMRPRSLALDMLGICDSALRAIEEGFQGELLVGGNYAIGGRLRQLCESYTPRADRAVAR